MHDRAQAAAVTAMLLLAMSLQGCATAPEEAQRLPLGERLDRLKQRTYERAQQSAERFDARFREPGKEPIPFTPTPFRIGVDAAAFDRPDGLDLNGNLRLDVSLSLPNLERRLRLFLTTDELTESPDLDESSRNRLRIGARYALLRDVDFDLGIRADLWPTAFGSIKWSQLHVRERWRWAPFVKTYLESDDGFGVAGGFTLDRRSGPWLLRSSSFYDWEARPDAAAWTQAFVIARVRSMIGDERTPAMARLEDIGEGWALRLAVSSPGDDNSRVGSYAATLLLRRHLHGRWLYGHAGPEVRFDREYDWNPDYGIRVGITALFRE